MMVYDERKSSSGCLVFHEVPVRRIWVPRMSKTPLGNMVKAPTRGTCILATLTGQPQPDNPLHSHMVGSVSTSVYRVSVSISIERRSQATKALQGKNPNNASRDRGR